MHALWNRNEWVKNYLISSIGFKMPEKKIQQTSGQSDELTGFELGHPEPAGEHFTRHPAI